MTTTHATGNSLPSRYLVIFLAFLAALVVAPAASRAETSANPFASGKVNNETMPLLDLFGEVCMKRFPDDAAVEEYMRAQNYQPMTEAQVREILKADPGVGWIRKDGPTEYRITLEKPPYHARGVRRFYPKIPDGYLGTYQLMVMMWAATQKANAKAQPSKSMPLGDAKIDAHLIGVLPAGGGGAELFMAIETRYKTGTAELRFVRSIPQK